jgi:hypothetical protein
MGGIAKNLLAEPAENPLPQGMRKSTEFVLITGMFTGVFYILGIIVSVKYGFKPLGKLTFLLCFICFNLVKNGVKIGRDFYSYLIHSMSNRNVVIRNPAAIDAM